MSQPGSSRVWRKGVIFTALLGGVPAPAAAQEAARVRVESPAVGAVHPWGEHAPAVSISAALRPGDSPASSRRFLTANVLSAGSIVDGVRLYDDATHGDRTAGDGVFTAIYSPPAPGSYTVKVRAQWDEVGSARTREAWSDEVPFHVEQVPYAYIVQPEAGARVGKSVTLRARIHQGGTVFTNADPTLQAEVWTVPADEAATSGPSRTAQRRGSLLTAPIQFPRVGEWSVGLAVSVERRGQRLRIEAPPAKVDVANPPIWAFIASGLLGVLFFLLPRRKSVPLYERHLQFRDSGSGRRLGHGIIRPAGAAVVRSSVGGAGSEIMLEKAASVLCTAVSEPGRRDLTIEARDGGPIRVRGGTQSAATLSPGERVQIGSTEIIYEDARPGAEGIVYHRWQVNTAPRAAFLALAAMLFGVGAWQYHQFFQQ